MVNYRSCLTLVVTDFLGLYRNGPVICGSLLASSDLLRASMETGFSTNDLDGEGLQGYVNKLNMIFSQDYILKEFNTDDWPRGPVV